VNTSPGSAGPSHKQQQGDGKIRARLKTEERAMLTLSVFSIQIQSQQSLF